MSLMIIDNSNVDRSAAIQISQEFIQHLNHHYPTEHTTHKSINQILAELSQSLATTQQQLNDYLSLLINHATRDRSIELFSHLNTVAYCNQYTHVSHQLNQLIKSVGSTTGVCGHVFQSREPAYQCKTCGIDPTCIQCLACFRSSKHIDHDYRMVNAGGGGMCDCGDLSSWKLEGCCTKHKGVDSANTIDVSSILSNDVKSQLQHTIQYIIRVLSISLASKQCNHAVYTIDTAIRIKSADTDALHDLLHPTLYCVYLLNDESHSYPQVVHQLDLCIEANQREALFLANFVDRTQSTLVCVTDNIIFANRVVSILNDISLGTTMKTVDNTIQFTVINDYTMLKLLQWLNQLTTQGTYFHQLIIDALCQHVNPTTTHNHTATHTDLTQSLLLDTWSFETSILQKDLFTEFQKLLFSLFVNAQFKQLFTERLFIYTDNYVRLLQISVKQAAALQYSALDWTVQLLTIPSIAEHMCKQHNLLSKLANILSTIFATITGQHDVIDALKLHIMQYLPYQRIIADIEYCLRINDVIQYICDVSGINASNASKGLIVFVSVWCDILSKLEYMDLQSRHTDRHIEYESSAWKDAFTLTIRTHSTTTLLIQSIRSVLKKLKQSNNISTLKKLVEYLLNSVVRALTRIDLRERERSTELDSTWRQVHNSTVYVPRGRTEQSKVSFHHPVYRLFGLLCIEMIQLDIMIPSSIINSLSEPDTVMIHAVSKYTEVPLYSRFMLPILRVLATSAHIESGIWLYNGYSIINQQYNYSRVDIWNGLKRSDILLILNAVLFDVTCEWLLTAVVKSYGLLSYYTNQATIESPLKKQRYKQWSAEKLIHVNELLLEFILIILCDRKLTGIYTDTQIQQLSIIEQLLTGPKKLSELQSVDIDDDDELIDIPDITEYVRDVADYKQPSQSNSNGVYELKQSFINLYNPYTTAYISADKQLAETYYLQRTRINSTEQLFPPLLNLPPFKPAYTRLNELMLTDMYIRIIQVNLYHTTTSTSTKYISERTVNHTLSMISIALQQYQYLSSQQQVDLWKQFNTSVLHDIPPITDLLMKLFFVSTECNTESTIDLTMQNSLMRHLLHTIGILSPDDRGKQIMAGLLDINGTSSPINNVKQNNLQLAKRVQQYHRSMMIDKIRTFASKHNIDIPWLNNTNTATSNIHTSNSADNDIDMLNPSQSDGVNNQHTASNDTCVICRSNSNTELLCRIGYVSMTTLPAVGAIPPNQSVNNNTRQRQPCIYKHNSTPMSYIRHCGHVLHDMCHLEYIETLRNKQNSELSYEGQNSINIGANEFVCPLCKSLSNTLTPIITAINRDHTNVVDIYGYIASDQQQKSYYSALPAKLLMGIVDVAHRSTVLETLVQHARISDIEPLIHEFTSIDLIDNNYVRNVFVILCSWYDSLYQAADKADYIAQLTAAHTRTVLDNDFQSQSDTRPVMLPITINITSVSAILQVVAILADEKEALNFNAFNRICDTITCIEHNQRSNFDPYNINTDSHDTSGLRDMLHAYTYQLFVSSLQQYEHWSIIVSQRVICDKLLTRGFVSYSENDANIFDHAISRSIRQLVFYSMTYWGRAVLFNEAIMSAIRYIIRYHTLSYIIHTSLHQVRDNNHHYALTQHQHIDTDTATIHPIIRQLLHDCSLMYNDTRSCCQSSVLGLILHLIPTLRQFCIFTRLMGITTNTTRATSLVESFNSMLSELHIHSSLHLMLTMPSAEIAPLHSQPLHNDITSKHSAHQLSVLVKHYGVNDDLQAYVSEILQQVDHTGYNHQLVDKYTISAATPYQLTYYTTPELSKLPQWYDELFQLTADDTAITCARCRTIPRHPAICLVCMTMLCANSTCCHNGSQGEFTQHQLQCTPNNALYLTLQDSRIYYVTGALAIADGGVYVDKNDELDIGLKRGRTLHLDVNRYTHVKRMWAKQEITNYVSRERNKKYPQDVISLGLL